MPKVKDYLISAKSKLVLALAPYNRVTVQPMLPSSPPPSPTEAATYPSSSFPDGVNERLQGIHETIGEVRKESNLELNLNSIIKYANFQTASNILEIIIDLEKTFLPLPGFPPIKRSLEAHVENAIDELETALFKLNPKASINKYDCSISW